MEKTYTDAEILEMVNKPDITFVKNKDSNRYYRHALKDELRIEELKNEGFRVVSEDDGAEPDSPVAVQKDGTSKVSNIPGHILMSRPRGLNEKIKEAKRDRFEAIAKREEEEAMEAAKKALDKIGVTGKLKRRLETVSKEF